MFVLFHFIITSLDINSDSRSPFTLNCTSSGSPATTVTWTKDGVVLRASGTYQMTQVLQDGVTATYSNLLVVRAGPYAVIGDYSCEVSNSIGSDRRNATFRGKFTDSVSQ